MQFCDLAHSSLTVKNIHILYIWTRLFFFFFLLFFKSKFALVFWEYWCSIIFDQVDTATVAKILM